MGKGFKRWQDFPESVFTSRGAFSKRGKGVLYSHTFHIQMKMAFRVKLVLFKLTGLHVNLAQHYDRIPFHVCWGSPQQTYPYLPPFGFYLSLSQHPISVRIAELRVKQAHLLHLESSIRTGNRTLAQAGTDFRQGLSLTALRFCLGLYSTFQRRIGPYIRIGRED